MWPSNTLFAARTDPVGLANDNQLEMSEAGETSASRAHSARPQRVT